MNWGRSIEMEVPCFCCLKLSNFIAKVKQVVSNVEEEGKRDVEYEMLKS